MAEVLSQSQIDALLNAALTGSMSLEEPVEESPQKKYRKYDFYSPRKFTKDRLRILSGIFDSYTRILTGRINGLLHTACEIEVESIEEQRYYDFSNALTEGDILTLGNLYYQDDLLEETPVLYHVTQPILLSMLDRLIGCAGDQDKDIPSDYSLTDLELKLFESLIRDFVSIMGNSWENYISLDFQYSRLEANPTLVSPLSLDETVVIVTIKLGFPNGEGRLSVCFPAVLLTNIFAIISRESSNARGSTEDKSTEIFSSLRSSELEMVVELCRTRLQLRDVYHLGVGDVINLNRPKDAPVCVNIGDRRWFDAKMGVHNSNLAIKIEETYRSQEGDIDQDE